MILKEYDMQKDLSTLSDEQLVLLSVEGNIEAEETILHRYKNYVKSKARTYYLIGADNDDIVQEGMIGLYKAVRDFKPDKNITFKTFADVCITRQILTAIRTANRNKHNPLNGSLSMNAPLFNDDSGTSFINLIQYGSVSNPEEIFIVDESLKEIKNEISKKLSGFENNVLKLYMDGLSYVEISETIGKSIKSVDNALQRIKKKLMDLNKFSK